LGDGGDDVEPFAYERQEGRNGEVGSAEEHDAH
jgi:hypothetical protein